MRSIVRGVQLESAVSVLRLYHPHFEDRLRIVGVTTPLLQHTIAQEARCLAQDPGAADDDLIASGRRRRRRNTPEDSVTRSPWRFISSSHTRFARSCVVCRILIHGDHSPQRCRTLGTRCVCGSWALKWQHRRHGSVCSTRVGHGGCGRTGLGMACGWCGHGPKGLWRCGDAVRSSVLTCAGACCSPSSVTLRLKHLRQRCYAVLDCRPCSYRR